MGIFEYYLIGVNIIGFFLYLLNMFLYSHTENAQIDAILTIGALIVVLQEYCWQYCYLIVKLSKTI